jgi:hypothetical protein
MILLLSKIKTYSPDIWTYKWGYFENGELMYKFITLYPIYHICNFN